MNPTTGKRYRGGNMIHLMLQDHRDPRWMTYRQAQEAGAQVKRKKEPTLFTGNLRRGRSWRKRQSDEGAAGTSTQFYQLCFQWRTNRGVAAVPGRNHANVTWYGGKLLEASGATIINQQPGQRLLQGMRIRIPSICPKEQFQVKPYYSGVI